MAARNQWNREADLLRGVPENGIIVEWKEPWIDGCVKGAAGGMHRNNVAWPLCDVCVTKESDRRCKITCFLKNVLRCTTEKQPYIRRMYTSAIFTTSDENIKENYVKEPVETGSATGNQFHGGGWEIWSEREKRRQEHKCSERWKKTRSCLFFFFFAFVKLGVTPGVGKKCG